MAWEANLKPEWDGEVNVYSIDEDGHRGWIAETYTEGNAFLIAAAPEMRAALKAVHDNGGFGFLSDEAQGQVVAALAKAKGE